MELSFWQVDAFTNEILKGNPTAVFVLDAEISDDLMQNIAIEMNLSETAFILLQQNENPHLRWFTPMYEIDLCGHATLASAAVYLNKIYPSATSVTFDTKFVGPLTISKNDDILTMNFPLRPGETVDLSSIPDFILSSLSDTKPISAFQSRDIMLVYEDPNTIIEMKPDFHAWLDYKESIIVTAKSNDPKYDFISRCFCVADGTLEDPVTGSAHCTSAPYWSAVLQKTTLTAYQASKRGGILYLNIAENRLYIAGQCVIAESKCHGKQLLEDCA